MLFEYFLYQIHYFSVNSYFEFVEMSDFSSNHEKFLSSVNIAVVKCG